jgi:hypothetical protein
MSLFILGFVGAAIAQEAPVSTASSASADVSPDQERSEVMEADARGPRIVRKVWVTIEVADPQSEVISMRELVRSVGGVVRSASTAIDSEYGDTSSLGVEVPVAEWVRIESALDLGATGSLESESIARRDQEGDGPPHVALMIDYETPTGTLPNFLIGPVGGISLPADTTGLGLGQLVGVRVMSPDRDGVFEVTYAPANQAYAEGQPEPWMVKLTAGGTFYSEFMGNGERAFLNPFIGGQLGYAYRGESWFVLQGEVGVELLHLGHVIWDVHARPTGAFRKGAVGLSVEAGTGLLFPF